MAKRKRARKTSAGRKTARPAAKKSASTRRGKPARGKPAKGISYGVLRGRVVGGTREDNDPKSPHYVILVEAPRGSEKKAIYRAVVNVKSAIGNGQASEVLFSIDDNLLRQRDPALVTGWRKKIASLSELPLGYTPLPKREPGINLDYVREGYVHPSEMTRLPATGPHKNDDVQDLLEFWVNQAMEGGTTISIFGEGFGTGIHDVHMNQGNSGRFKKDNGIYQDGGIVLSMDELNRHVGVFVAFQSQSWNTDDNGDPLD